MKKIAKRYENLNQVERYQNRLYNKHYYVRLVSFPIFSERGTYVWEVGSKEDAAKKKNPRRKKYSRRRSGRRRYGKRRR